MVLPYYLGCFVLGEFKLSSAAAPFSLRRQGVGGVRETVLNLKSLLTFIHAQIPSNLEEGNV